MNLSLDLRKIFPLTFSLLTQIQSEDEQSKLVTDFLTEWGGEQLHFFPMLLREQGFPLKIQEVSDYEYLRHWVRTVSFAQSGAKPFLVLNLSLQFIQLHQSAEFLEKPPGLYLIWQDAGRLQEKRATEEEARLLDRLREDQVVYPEDLCDMEYKTLQNLRKLGMVINGSAD